MQVLMPIASHSQFFPKEEEYFNHAFRVIDVGPDGISVKDPVPDAPDLDTDTELDDLIAEDLAPVRQALVRGQEDRASLVAPGHELKEEVGAEGLDR